MAIDLTTWKVPDVSPDDADDKVLMQTPFYINMKESGMADALNHATVMKIVKQAWKDSADQLEQAAYSEVSAALFAKAIARDLVPDTGDAKITVERKAQPDGSFRYAVKSRKAGGKGKRLKDEQLARLIGLGEPNDELAKLCEEGGFIFTRKGGSVNKPATFELVFEDGTPGNGVCEQFTAKLYTRIEGESHPVFVYPPASGDKAKLTRNDEVYEVPSWTKMSEESPINSPFSPLKLFKLAEAIDALDAPEGEGESEGEQPQSEDVDIDDLDLDDDAE